MAIIITDADKQTVTALQDRLQELTVKAKEINSDSTFPAIIEAQNNLCRARELHNTLTQLGLIEGLRVTKDDIDRVDQKISDILEEKHRQRQWKH